MFLPIPLYCVFSPAVPMRGTLPLTELFSFQQLLFLSVSGRGGSSSHHHPRSQPKPQTRASVFQSIQPLPKDHFPLRSPAPDGGPFLYGSDNIFLLHTRSASLPLYLAPPRAHGREGGREGGVGGGAASRRGPARPGGHVSAAVS